ncbi:MAG TPA: hypothetical protein VH560_04420 [Polyangia bacterium]|nr:hypothetical protein [Polyangia bacterium]
MGCINSAPISAGPPQVIGCYFGTEMCGWQKVECDGELDVSNLTNTAAKIQFAFTLVPSTVIPSLSGAPDVEVAFEDPDGAWAATWSSQPGNGTAFVLTKGFGNPNGGASTAGVTTIRLGGAHLVLAPVSLGLRRATVVQAVMNEAPTSAQLNMEAVVTDAAGHHIQYDTGTCHDEPPPT